MFDEKQIEQYRAVKASPELMERVAAIEKSGRVYYFNRKAVSAIAACLVAVIALVSYFGASSGMSAQLVYKPIHTASYSRSSVQKTVIKLDVNGSYTVTALSGEFDFDEERVRSVELDGEAELDWFVPTVGEHVITVKKGLIIKRYRLFTTEQGWELEKV